MKRGFPNKKRALPLLPDLVPYILPAESSLETCRATLGRIRDGIALLASDEKAAEAFRFANQAMAQQRIRTIYTREIRQKKNDKLKVEEFDLPKNRSWRPFQLAFMLLNIPALVDPTHPDRIDPTFAKADLLWPHRRWQDRSLFRSCCFRNGLTPFTR